MSAIARVLETEFKSDGRIENLVRVDAPTESVAKRKARRAALRNNGYSDTVLESDKRDISMEIQGTKEIGLFNRRRRFVIKVITTGVGEYFKV